MLRGDVRWVEFGPGLPGEPSRKHPAIIVSNDGVNASASRTGRGVVAVVGVTSNVRKVHPFEVLLGAGEANLPRESKAQTQLVRAVSVARVGPRIGTVPPALMREIDEALRMHLALG